MKKLLFGLTALLAINASAVYTQVSGYVDEIRSGYSGGGNGYLYQAYVIDVSKLSGVSQSSASVLEWVLDNHYNNKWNAKPSSGTNPFTDMSAVVATLTYTDTHTEMDVVGLGNYSASIFTSDPDNLFLVSLVSYNYSAYAHVGEVTTAGSDTLKFDDANMQDAWDKYDDYGYGDGVLGTDDSYDYWHKLGRGIPEPSSALLLLLGLTGLALKRKEA